jgi:hypothetical protein
MYIKLAQNKCTYIIFLNLTVNILIHFQGEMSLECVIKKQLDFEIELNKHIVRIRT